MLEQRIKRREGRRLQELEVEKELQGRGKIARGSLKLGEDCEEGGGLRNIAREVDCESEERFEA